MNNTIIQLISTHYTERTKLIKTNKLIKLKDYFLFRMEQKNQKKKKNI